MRLEYLKTFLTVNKKGSFSVAANKLGTSQGTVSNHIAALEEYFNAELFLRTAKGVELTEAGKILQETAEKILSEVEDAKAKIVSAKGKLAGIIRIAASTIPGEHIIPSLIASFQERHPDVKFKIKAEDSVTCLLSLQANDADFAVVGTIRGYTDKFDTIKVGSEELVLIVPCDHELARRNSVKLKEILKYPYINRDESSGTRCEVEKMLEDARISLPELVTKFELGSTEAVITAVSEGNGVSIVSSIASNKAQAAGLVKILKIDDVDSNRSLYIAKPKRSLSEPSEAFWKFCRDYKAKKIMPQCSES